VVSFCPEIRVVLVPSRGEYKKAGLYGELWWNSSEFFSFQAAANSEIRLLSAYEGIGAKAARKKLYQPNEEDASIEDILSQILSISEGVAGGKRASDEGGDDDDGLEFKVLSSPVLPTQAQHASSPPSSPSSPAVVVKAATSKGGGRAKG